MHELVLSRQTRDSLTCGSSHFNTMMSFFRFFVADAVMCCWVIGGEEGEEIYLESWGSKPQLGLLVITRQAKSCFRQLCLACGLVGPQTHHYTWCTVDRANPEQYQMKDPATAAPKQRQPNWLLLDSLFECPMVPSELTTWYANNLDRMSGGILRSSVHTWQMTGSLK